MYDGYEDMKPKSGFVKTAFRRWVGADHAEPWRHRAIALGDERAADAGGFSVTMLCSGAYMYCVYDSWMLNAVMAV